MPVVQFTYSYQAVSGEISVNQSTLPSVLFFSLLFRHWREALHRAFHYVNLSNMCIIGSKDQAASNLVF